MYNLFMLVGIVEKINLGSVDLNVQKMHLEIICEFDMSYIKVGQTIAIKGKIHEDGLYAERIVSILKGGEENE